MEQWCTAHLKACTIVATAPPPSGSCSGCGAGAALGARPAPPSCASSAGGAPSRDSRRSGCPGDHEEDFRDEDGGGEAASDCVRSRCWAQGGDGEEDEEDEGGEAASDCDSTLPAAQAGRGQRQRPVIQRRRLQQLLVALAPSPCGLGHQQGMLGL